MAISHEDLSENLRCIALSGRLDFQGVEEIAEQFASLLACAGRSVVVDLTAASVICSLGIRALILNSRAIQRRGGRMALVVTGDTAVSATLKSVGIETLLPVFANIPEAAQALMD